MAGRVLVVDDDDDIRQSMAEALTDAGYAVATAAHGGEALADMRSRPPCIVVLDLMMPVVDGWAVLREMQNDPALLNVPVCVVSAVANRAPTGVDCVLGKPVSLDRLLAVVESSCGRP
jgi:CheY-like chemotaxis protein